MNKKRINYILIILIPLSLSAYTHLWNLLGFPSIHIDEAHYLRRALLVLDGMGPQESAVNGYPRTYDHPYFGQLFLAGILATAGYPNSLNPSSEITSIESLHLVPRIVMGFLAVLDTFLIYQICQRRYGQNVAFIASVLFAVMPMTWLLRRIYLDNLLLPFLLCAILFGLYIKPMARDMRNSSQPKDLVNNYIWALLSGIFLGLAIYTKIPSFTMIPLIGGLVFFNSKRNLKMVGLWVVPVFLIPLLWPLYSIVVGQSDLWTNWVLWQTERDKPLHLALINFFQMDPVIMIIGAAGIIFARIRRDYFPLLWVLPFLFFSYFIGFVQYFHLIVIFPAFCVGSAILLDFVQKIARKHVHRIFSFGIPALIGVFGIVITTMLITTNVNSDYFKIYESIVQKLPTGTNNENVSVTIIGSHWWDWNTYWVTQQILQDKHYLIDPMFDRDFKEQLKTEKVLFVADTNFLSHFKGLGKNFQNIVSHYNQSKLVAKFMDNVTSRNTGKYPFNTMSVMILGENHPVGEVQIRANY
ncbi:MAG: glycosyltransferase family 39 protein [Nitrososphaeraceae archaeon]